MGSRAWREGRDPHKRNGPEMLKADVDLRLSALRTGDLMTCPESPGEPNAVLPTTAFLPALPGRLEKATKLRQPSMGRRRFRG